MKNWKTMLSGVVGALGISLLASSNPLLKLAGVVLGAVGNIGMGATAKDKNVTGGNTPNDIR